MKKNILLLLGFVLFTACQTKTDEFIIKNKQVGELTDSTTVAQMKKIFEKDSIIKKTHGQSAFEPYDEYIIVDKKNKEALLAVIPQKTNDEQAILKEIDILSPRYKTEKGVGLASDFGTFKKQHKIGRIDETFKYIVIFIDDLNATIALSKDVLPLNAQNDRRIKVDETLIPEQAPVKKFTIFLNE